MCKSRLKLAANGLPLPCNVCISASSSLMWGYFALQYSIITEPFSYDCSTFVTDAAGSGIFMKFYQILWHVM